MSNRSASPDPARRRFLADGCRLAAASLCLPLAGVLNGCNGDKTPASPAEFRVALAELPLDTRVRFENNGRALELTRTADGVAARSLLCTHQGCNVRWHDDQQIYICPCHDGQFDADGRPLYGPPREPLRLLPVTVTETEVVVGG